MSNFYKPYIISNQANISDSQVKRIELLVPEDKWFVEVLQSKLKLHFNEVTVKWEDCPDLTKEPFNLVAPGLCGREAIIDIGQLNIFPKIKKTYIFQDLMNHFNRSHNDTFIIGGSVYPRSSNNQLSQFTTNMLFPKRSKKKAYEENLNVKNNSFLAFFNEETDEGTFETLVEPNFDSKPKCNLYGNFFISEGKPGKILKVHVKQRIGFDLPRAMQSILTQNFPSEVHQPKFIGLGGAFTAYNGLLACSLVPKVFNTKKESILYIDRNCDDVHIQRHESHTPLIAMGTILSHKTCSFYAFSNNLQAGGHFISDFDSRASIEYLGYFRPAKNLYHVD